MAEVRSDMVANVWKVLVSKGQSVTEGDEVAILESMKMEIPIAAPTSGTVTNVAVAEGEQIQEGHLILTIG